MCDITALAHYRRASAPGGYGSLMTGAGLVPDDLVDRALPTRRGRPDVAAPTASCLDRLEAHGVVDEAASVHVMVSAPEAKRNLRGIVCHQMPPSLASHSLYPLVVHGRHLEGIYVCSPELALTQALARLDLIETLLLSYELCGTYRVLPEWTSYGCEPITSRAKLAGFARRETDVAHHAKLARISRWLLNGSASPPETQIAAALMLPRRLGGYGLPPCELNTELPVSGEAARLLGRLSITPDGYWRGARVPYEYDSKQFHSAEEQARYDEKRRNAYAALGMVASIFKTEHLADPMQFDAMARSLRRNLGLRAPVEPKGYALTNRELLTHLMKQRRHDERR